MAVNFERPYFAKSLSEFGRKWHMTLGGWMKDYVFYPLSLSRAANKLGKKTRKWFGNQTGKMIPTFLAMFVTFMLVGIWHGAETKYIAYGFWNAGIISSSILLEPVYKKMAAFCHINTQSRGWQEFHGTRPATLETNEGRIRKVTEHMSVSSVRFEAIHDALEHMDKWYPEEIDDSLTNRLSFYISFLKYHKRVTNDQFYLGDFYEGKSELKGAYEEDRRVIAELLKWNRRKSVRLLGRKNRNCWMNCLLLQQKRDCSWCL